MASRIPWYGLISIKAAISTGLFPRSQHLAVFTSQPSSFSLFTTSPQQLYTIHRFSTTSSMAAAKKKSASKKKTAAKASQDTPPSPNSQNSREAHDEGVPLEPIDAFFAEYPTFNFQRNGSFWDQFRRLMRHMSWGGIENERKREDAKKRFKTALVEQFNYAYGTDDRSLEAWQRLCRILGVGEPTTLKEARTLVQRTHVNLCDLTEHPVTGQEVKIFPSVHALRVYTIRTEKYFPKKDAKAGGLLKKLLREIRNISPSKQQLQKKLPEHQEQQQQPDQSSSKVEEKKKTKKKQKKKSNQEQQPGKAIKRKDSGVHLGDSPSLSGAE